MRLHALGTAGDAEDNGSGGSEAHEGRAVVHAAETILSFSGEQSLRCLRNGSTWQRVGVDFGVSSAADAAGEGRRRNLS